MKPLQWVAMGYVVIALFARTAGGFDLLPDPVGWLMILTGVRRLPATSRGTLLYVGAVALVVSAALWVPAINDALDRTDPSLPWAADLPAIAFGVLLCRELGSAAGRAGESRAPQVLQGLVTVSLVVGAMPILVFGAGMSSWGPIADGAGQLLHLALVIVLFAYCGRTWAGASATGASSTTA